MNYRVTHTTTYAYSEPVTLSHGLIHITPRDGPRQTCRQHQLLLTPHPAVTKARTDYFGNHVTFFTLQEAHQKLTVMARSLVEVTPYRAPVPAETPSWDHARAALATDQSAQGLETYQLVFDSPYIATSRELADYAAPSLPPGRPLLEAALDLTQRIHRDFRYDHTATTVATPLHDVLRLRRGVCQDFAHLQIGCLRSHGLAARYVSGYLLTNPPPGQQRLVGADASHAWLAVYCPGAGWIDLDPTNNQVPSERHITLAWGRDYDDVSPIKGVILGGGQHSVAVGVDVVLADAAGHAAQPAPGGMSV
jgi:transglutaminase-like putative cysteine protease